MVGWDVRDWNNIYILDGADLLSLFVMVESDSWNVLESRKSLQSLQDCSPDELNVTIFICICDTGLTDNQMYAHVRLDCKNKAPLVQNIGNQISQSRPY